MKTLWGRAGGMRWGDAVETTHTHTHTHAHTHTLYQLEHDIVHTISRNKNNDLFLI